MIAWWMTQSLFIGAWLAGAAMLLDVAMRRLGRPARAAWVAALLGLAALTAWSIGRPETPVAPAAMPVELPGPAATVVVPAASLPWGDLFAAPQELLRHAGRAILRWEASLALEPWLGGLWLTLSALTALALLGLHARVAVRRRRWPVLGDIDGVPVRIADDEGPCVIGLVPAEIVLPAWAASLPDGARALIIAHEREHVRGGDPWLFAVANAVLVALPWHPLAWWMQARLRLAIEVDCDRRCLAGGTDTGTYGRLLIAAAGHTQSRLPWRAVAPAFATRRSHLERRLLAMTPATRRPRRALALAAGALSLVAGAAACESAAPTAAQVAAADASTVQATLVPTLADSNVTYVVNGRVVSAAEAKQVQAKDIATIAVAKRSDGAQVQIEIKDDRAPGERTQRATRTPGGSRTPALDQALIVIDGVVQENPSAMNALSPERIANVEIVKGGAATALYDVSKYPKAANGVVKITTKR